MNNSEILVNIIDGNWRKIWIISHNPSDVDCIASMMLMNIFIENSNSNKDVSTVIELDLITKPNQKKFARNFRKNLGKVVNIRDFREDLNNDNDLFIIVDAQYGEGNLTPMVDLVNKNVIILDHHVKSSKQIANFIPLFEHIDSKRCSCTSLLYEYVKHIHHADIANIIYNGMYNDTNGFKKDINTDEAYLKYVLESGVIDRNPIDRDLIHELNRASFSSEDKKLWIEALENYKKIENVALVYIDECDVNVLGHLTDNLTEIEGNDVVISYFLNMEDSICRLSVRSYDSYVNAIEWIKELTVDVGSGGGHLKATAGNINIEKVKQKYGMNMHEYLLYKVQNVFKHYDKFCYGEVDMNKVTEGCKQAVKKEYLLRIIDLKDCFCDPTPRIKVETLEGYLYIYARYLVIGVKGEIYPVDNLSKYEKYVGEITEDLPLYDFSDKDDDYEIRLSAIYLNTNIRLCKKALMKLPIYKSNRGNEIMVKELDKPTKVISKWDSNPLSGKKGDYLAINGDDIYIIDREVFYLTYEIKEE